MIDEFVIENVADSGNGTSNMELTRDNLMVALDEFNFRSERPLPHEYELFRKLIDEYFETKENLSYAIKMYEDLLSKYAILFDNPPLKFEELKVGMWVWDTLTNSYRKISNLSESNGAWLEKGKYVYYSSLLKWEHAQDYYEGRFYCREVKND